MYYLQLFQQAFLIHRKSYVTESDKKSVRYQMVSLAKYFDAEDKRGVPEEAFAVRDEN